jgi:tRNA wybutosine-synthesizing protein 3
MSVSQDVPEQIAKSSACEDAYIDGTVEQSGADAKMIKEARVAAASQAADIEELWLKYGDALNGMRLIRSDDLPRKQAPTQKGNPGSEAVEAAARDCEKMVAAAAEAHSKFGEQGHACSLSTLLAEVRAVGPLQWRGDVALLPRDSLIGGACEHLARESKGGLWEMLRSAIGARLLARQQEILVDDEVRGGAVHVLAGDGDGWVIVPGPKDIRYTFDITRCMFSDGNAAEKARVAEWPVKGEVVLDMYAGIGFWTLPLLVAGAERVFACEWNPDAVEALHRGLSMLPAGHAGRCEVLAGDNRRPEVVDCVAGRCHRVMLGLIPTSRDGFPVAVAALRNEGGLLHVHWNVASDAEYSTAEAIASELQTAFRAARGEGWCCSVRGVQRVKWYAPRVRHVRIDMACKCVSSQS